jgi:hypothetical protein
MKYVLSNLIGIAPPNPQRPMDLIHKRNYPYVKKRQILNKYQDYFRFCIVRNPWDRVLSCYINKINPDKNYNDKWFKNGVALSLVNFKVFKGGMSFEDFIYALKDIPDNKADNHFRSQHMFIVDKNGNLLVNYIGRFEDITTAFEHICQKMGLSDIVFPHLLKSDHEKYRSYYNDRLIDIVSERYSTDIDMFGYDF